MKHALITGGTKGIGRACVEYFGERGWSVTAIARGRSALEALATDWQVSKWSGQLRTIAADLATETGIANVPAEAYDLVVFNAAAYRPGLLLGETDVFTELHDLNVRSNHLLARRLVPGMVASGKGRVVAIGSLGTDFWPEHMTAYLATKYALRGLYLGWERELAGTGVGTTLVAPGATLTDSWANEIPPPDILSPAEVATTLGRVVTEGINGRVLVTPTKK